MTPHVRRLAVALLAALTPLTGRSPAQTAPRWTLGAAQLEVGKTGAIDLTGVVGAAFLPGGNVAIADGDNFRVLIVSPRGALVRQFGREGRGPGDFGGLDGLAAFGDTILTYDGLLNRVTVFTAGGRVVRTSQASVDGQAAAELRAIASPTLYVSTTSKGGGRTASGIYHDTNVVILADQAAKRVTPLATLEWRYSYHYTDPKSKTTITYSTPFVGESLASAVAGRAVILPLGSPDLEIVRENGTRAKVRLPFPARTFDREMVRTYRDYLLSRPSNKENPAQAERIAGVFGPTFPSLPKVSAAQQMRAVGDLLWIKGFPPARDTMVTWVVIDPRQERVLAQVTLPTNWAVFGGDGTRVLVRWRDQDDVESVAVLPIRR